MKRLKLAPLYDVVGKESKGVFLGANDFTLGSEEPSQYCYLAPGIKRGSCTSISFLIVLIQLLLSFGVLWLWHSSYPFDVFHRTVVFSHILSPFPNVTQPLLKCYAATAMQLVNHHNTINRCYLSVLP